MNEEKPVYKTRFDWIDALKAFAIIGILLNHFVEVLGPGPWFTNPSSNWPDFATRIQNLVPSDHHFIIVLIQYLGWLGDSGPGVFILLSGLALTLSVLNTGGAETFNTGSFYRKKLLRIFPLYILIHLFVLFVYTFIPNNNLIISEPYNFLSLIGLRFSDGLFFYLNPSWWFIWLILQLYIVFPLLINFLNKSGIRVFFIATLAFTFVSRGMGLIGYHYNNELYYWMTGLFFGTRLAEFATGMAIAVLLYRNGFQVLNQISKRAFFLWSLGIYMLGLICSFTWVGSIFSNLLVTLGLTGIGYIFWETLKLLNIKWLLKFVIWIGVSSYAIFLLHQPFIIWIAQFFDGHRRALFSFIALIVCIPFAYYFDKIAQFLLKIYQWPVNQRYAGWFLHANSIVLLFIWYFIEPKIPEGFFYNQFSLFIIIDLLVAILLLFKVKTKHFKRYGPLWIGVILSSLAHLFLFPANFGYLIVFFALCISFIGAFTIMFVRRQPVSIVVLLGLVIFIFLVIFGPVEKWLTTNNPLETTDRWGEYPALQADSSTVYSLIPNKTTHLKYNNYDYYVTTNSLGMNNPEFDITRPDSVGLRILVTGDAFTMPEGMEYPHSYTSILQNELNTFSEAKKRIQVINAGVTGYGPVETLAQLGKLVPLLKPDIVIYEFFINEFEEVNITPDERRKNIGLTSNLSDVKRYFNNSQVIAHLTKYKSTITEFIKENPRNWRYWKSLLYFYEKDDNQLYSDENINRVMQYLQSMDSLVRENSGKMLICFVPGAVAVTKKKDMNYFPLKLDLPDTIKFDFTMPLKALKRITDTLQVPVYDLSDTLRLHPIQPVYFPDSWHWNKEGHKVAAKAIREYLINYKFVD
jgi:peptidoglycan/LPS O-acetylase OafA/YrhL